MSPLMTASLMSPLRRRILAMVASVYWSMDPAMMVYSKAPSKLIPLHNSSPFILYNAQMVQQDLASHQYEDDASCQFCLGLVFRPKYIAYFNTCHG